MNMDKRLVVGIMVLLTSLIFILDVIFPRGQTSAMLFVSVVGATLWLPGRRSVYVSCAICTVATALGFILSPPGPIEIDLVNRAGSVLAFWMVGFLCILYKQNEQHSLRLAAIVESSLDAIISKSVDGTIINWNKGAEHLLGYKAEEAVGRPRSLTIPSRLEQQEATYLERIKHGELIEPYESVRRRKDGSEVPVSVAITAIRDRYGNLLGIASIARDISERKRMHEDVQRAREAAESANAAKSDFLASMSHEIRTPMNGVIGMLGLLMDAGLTPRQRELAETARSSADTLLTIINDILDFSKIEAGKLDIEPVKFDLLLAVEDVASLIAVRAEEKGLELIIDYSAGTPRRVVGDAGRVRQVLTNLAGNAVKFTERGHVLIALSTEEVNGANVRLRFTVEDTGIGIAPDKLHDVFGRFTQADASTTRKFGGTGLGLAISKQLVELMGGEIGVESELHRGSKFYFTLRLPLAKQAPPQPPITDLRGVRVLLVDDNDVNLRVLQAQVEGWSMRSTAVSSGEHALARLRQALVENDPYRVAIVDYVMPGMDGADLARAIQADPGLCGLRMVMLSSLGRRGEAALWQQLGFAAYLVKPVRSSQLHEALAAVLAQESPHAAMVTRHSVAEARAGRRDALPQWTGTRALVVDDNAVNQKVARMMLEQLGCRIDLAANGEEAVRMVNEFPFDIVFMDAEMPVMDGYAATQKIRQQEGSGRRVPIVAMTARAMQGDRERCLQAGMDDYVAKPVQIEKLAEMLHRWVNQQPREVDPASTPQIEPSASLPALDREVLAGLRSMAQATDPALFDQIMDSFLQDGRRGLTALRQALATGNAEELRQTAHRVKGMSASVGAHGLAELSRQLEVLAGSGSLSGAAGLIDAWAAEFERAQSQVNQELQRSA